MRDVFRDFYEEENTVALNTLDKLRRPSSPQAQPGSTSYLMFQGL